MEQTTWLPLDGFSWNLILDYFRKSVEKFQFPLTSDRTTVCLNLNGSIANDYTHIHCTYILNVFVIQKGGCFPTVRYLAMNAFMFLYSGVIWGKCGRCVRLTTLPPSCAVVMKSGNLNFLESSGPLQACNGTDLPFTLQWRDNDIHFMSKVVVRLRRFAKEWIACKWKHCYKLLGYFTWIRKYIYVNISPISY